MPHDPSPILIKDRRQQSLGGEIAASLGRGGADRRYERWSIGGVLLAVAIPVGFALIIWALVRVAFAN